jgi:acyl-CoA synthetase (AMP-forming)/AMP-acid ligase II
MHYQSYGELAARVERLAGGMVNQLGLKQGDRVAIAMTNCPQFVEALYAIWHAGLTAVPMNAKLHRREFSYIVSDAGARLCLVSDDLEESINSLNGSIESLAHIVSVDSIEYVRLTRSDPLALQDVSPFAPAWLFYTSGTTGRPKGAVLSHNNLLLMALSYFADIESLSHLDCIIHAAPLSHGSGLYGIPYVAKAASQVIPESRGFDPGEIGTLLENYNNVGFFFAPTMIVRLMGSDAISDSALANLRTIIYGGGPMYTQDLLGALDVFGYKLVQIYGQGESPMTITYLSKFAHADRDLPRYFERLSSVGVPRTDVEVRVVDEHDIEVPVNESGEIIVRGGVVMSGYWNNSEASKRALKGGWLHTGDVGMMDGDGYLSLKDRTKDLIISGGSNIYPREIEEVLLKHDSVLETSVVGRPHPDWGEEVVAFVARRPGKTVTEEELDGLCLENIARFKRPKSYRFVDALPKNNYGKILKTDLRELLDSAHKDED